MWAAPGYALLCAQGCTGLPLKVRKCVGVYQCQCVCISGVGTCMCACVSTYVSALEVCSYVYMHGSMTVGVCETLLLCVYTHVCMTVCELVCYYIYVHMWVYV